MASGEPNAARTFTLPDGSGIPAFGLGTWKSRGDAARRSVRTALELGYRHVDCASIYGNEHEVGAAIAAAIEDGVVTRDELWVTSKLWNDAHQRGRVEPALRASLQDLGLERVDLYLVHWPVALRPGVWVPKTPDEFLSLEEAPLADTWRGMEDCQRTGLCRFIGVSNFSERKLRHILDNAEIRPVVNQVEAHPFLQQRALLEFCRSEDMLLTAYSPLGSGDRPASMKDENEPSLLEHPVVGEIGARRGLTAAQVLIAWAITRGTIVIPKAERPEHQRHNMEAAAITLDTDEMDAIASLDDHFRYVTGAFWELEGGPYTTRGIWDEES